MIGKWNNRKFGRGIAALGLGIALTLGSSTAARAQTFGPKVQVHADAPGHDGPAEAGSGPAIAADSLGRVHAAWVGRKCSTCSYAVYYANSADGGESFGGSIRLNGADRGVQYGTRISMAVDPAGNVHVAWEDMRNGNLDIYYAGSSDGGRSFRADARVNDAESGSNQQKYPSIAAGPGGSVHIVWLDERPGSLNFAVYHAASKDGGLSFGANTRVDDAAAALRMSPSVAVDGFGNVHAAWMVNKGRSGRWVVRYAKSEDGGSTFGPEVQVDETAWSQSFPLIAVDPQGNPHVTWDDDVVNTYSLAHARSLDQGRTFEAKSKVADFNYAPRNLRHSMTIDAAGNVHLALENVNSRDASYAGSADGGKTFGAMARINDDASVAKGPSMAVAPNGDIHAAWLDYRYRTPSIHHAKSVDGGKSFGRNVRVDDPGAGTSDQSRPSLAVDPLGDVHVAWQDQRRDNWDILYAKSSDGGRSFGPEARVDDTGEAASNQFDPRIAVDAGGRAHVVWTDSREEGGVAVYYAKGADSGLSFENNVKLAHVPWNGQKMPALAVDSAGNIHAAWVDERHGSPAVYYAKSADGGKSFGANARLDEPPAAGWIGQQFPVLAVDAQDRVHIAWLRSKECFIVDCWPGTPDYDVYSSRSEDNGSTFGPGARVDDTGADKVSQYWLSISLDAGGNVYVLWLDDRSGPGKQERWYAKSADAGKSFGSDRKVGKADTYNSAVVVDPGGNFHAAWSDASGLFYAESRDEGRTFGQDVKVSGAPAWNIALAAGPASNVHLAWKETADWDDNVYYSRTISEDVTPPAVTILAPKEGAEVSGVVDISVKVQD